MYRKLTYQDHELVYSLTQEKVKNINLRVKFDGTIHVTAHPNVPLENIDEFIIAKWDWIIKAQLNIANRHQLKETSSVVIIFGHKYPLQIKTGKNKIVLDQKIVVYCNDPTDEKLIKRQLDEFLLKVLKQKVDEIRPQYDYLVKDYHQITPEISYRIMKTRWGSCQYQKGKIVLNKALVYYPLECLHYVVLHEYLHLIVPNHSKRFHELMAYHLPDYKKIKYLLNNYPLSSVD